MGTTTGRENIQLVAASGKASRDLPGLLLGASLEVAAEPRYNDSQFQMAEGL
jgi:hypothetical protein